MQRRDFLAASAAAATGLMASTFASAQAAPAQRPLFELRTYRFGSAQKLAALEAFLDHVAIPAFNRAGVEPVGAFKLLAQDNPSRKPAEDGADLYVFLPHKSFESVLTLEKRLGSDEEFQKAGETILHAPKSNPAFLRYDSTLLEPMEKQPNVVVPARGAERLFELRTYESHNNERALNKLKMFNMGEFPIFGQAGMPGVFFGGAIVGENLPQLTYMIVHPDPKNVKNNWNAFMGNADWKKLSSESVYKENVSKVISLFLRPTAGSQI